MFPLSNSMKGKGDEEQCLTIFCVQVCEEEREEKAPPNPLQCIRRYPVLQSPHMRVAQERKVEVVDGWGIARTSLHKASIPRSGVCPEQKVEWKVKFSFIFLLSSHREDQEVLVFSVRPFASQNAGEEYVEIKQGLQKTKLWESWNSPSKSFLMQKNVQKDSQVIPGLGLQFAFTAVGSSHS